MNVISNPGKVSTRSGTDGNRALETPNDVQSAGVPARHGISEM